MRSIPVQLRVFLSLHSYIFERHHGSGSTPLGSFLSAFNLLSLFVSRAVSHSDSGHPGLFIAVDPPFVLQWARLRDRLDGAVDVLYSVSGASEGKLLTQWKLGHTRRTCAMLRRTIF